MSESIRSNSLESRLTAMIAPALEGMGFDLVRVAVLGRGVPTVQIMADRADGSLIKVEDCQEISYAIGALLDVKNPLPGAWHLEVSSPGIDRPLTRVKDWNRFAGHQAKVELFNPLKTDLQWSRKRFAGVILSADEEFGRLRLEDGVEVALPLHDVSKARLVLTDALMQAQKPAGAAFDVNATIEEDGDESGDESGVDVATVKRSERKLVERKVPERKAPERKIPERKSYERKPDRMKQRADEQGVG